jgi:glutaredoxin 3
MLKNPGVVKVYTIENCPFCSSAKALLTQRGIKFQEVHVDEDDDKALNALIEKSGMRTFPQIFFGENCIGGFTDLKDLDSKD